MNAPAGRLRFRPTLGLSLATLLALMVLVGLGTWQMQRLDWKTALIARIEARIHSAPEPLPATIDDPAAWDYRPATVTGIFLHDKEQVLGPRTMAGPDGLARMGVHVLTPLQRADGGGIVLVERGWVPAERQDPASRAEGQVADTVTVAGIARLPQGRSWMQPDNRPGDRFWFWYDLPAMAAAAGVGAVQPVILQAGPAPNPGGLPVGGRTVVQIKNDHLSYALTWYGLAATLIGVYIAFSLRRDPA